MKLPSFGKIEFLTQHARLICLLIKIDFRHIKLTSDVLMGNNFCFFVKLVVFGIIKIKMFDDIVKSLTDVKDVLTLRGILSH